MTSFGICGAAVKGENRLVPSVGGKVGIYVCGVTIQNSCHVGHIRMMVSYDTLVRWLRELGHDVFLVRNITDFAEKLLLQTDGLSLWLQTEPMVLRLKKETAAFNLIQPDFEPRAACYVRAIQKLVKQLVKRKAGQLTAGGDVCFCVSKRPVALATARSLTTAARNSITTNKETSGGFAVWKTTTKTNSRLGWLSPYGIGRPGWHIECSTMCYNSFRTAVDLHGGGQDLRFPHHSNERTQNDILVGKGYVKHWLHSGLISVRNAKMSNSANNPISAWSLLKEFQPEATRFYVLCSHYATQLEFFAPHLRRAQTVLAKICVALPTLVPKCNRKLGVDWNERTAWLTMCFMNQDANAPPVISLLVRALKFAENNGCLILQRQHLKLIYALGLMKSQTSAARTKREPGGWLLVALAIDCSVLRRCDARSNRCYALADEQRLRLNSWGVVVNDNADLTVWSWVGNK